MKHAPSTRLLLAAGLIFTLGIIVYSNSFTAGFHFDDYHQVVRNQNIRSLANMPRFFTERGLDSYYRDSKGFRPLTIASYCLNYALGGYNVAGYHVFNLLLHLVNAFLVFIVTGAALKEAGREDAYFPALTAALIFVLHPIQTSAVTYISGRAVLLASLFCLTAFYSHLRSRSGRGRRKLAWAAAAPAFFMLGLLSKETAVGLIGIILAYDLIFAAEDRGGPGGYAKALLQSLPVFATLAAYLLYRKMFLGFTTVWGRAYGTGEYLMSEAKVLLMYVRLLFLPTGQNMDYDLPATSSVDAKVLAAAVLVGLAITLLYRLREKDPAAAFFGLWFFIAIAPESTLVPIPDLAMEYRLYLPSVGFIVALSLLARGYLKACAFKRGLAIAVMLPMGLLTFNRNVVMSTEYTLWSDVVRKSPHSFNARLNLGRALYNDGRYLESIVEFSKAVREDTDKTEQCKLHNNLGLSFLRLDMSDKAIEEFNKAVELDPGLVEPYVNLGDAYYKTGRYAEAAKILGKAISVNPGYIPARLSLAATYVALGSYRGALAQMEEALRYSPRDFTVRYYLALAYRDNGMTDKAAGQAGAALSLASDEHEKRDAGALLEKLQGMGRN